MEDEFQHAIERVSREIEELERLAQLPGFLDAIPFFTVKRDYRAFWQKAREVTALFKETRLPPKERSELWSRYGDLCEAVKDLQAREREERQNESAHNRDQIMSYLREAHLWAGGAKDSQDLSEAQTRLTKAMEILKEKYLLREDRESCWELWREISDQVRDRRAELRTYNYDAIYRDVEAVSSVAAYGDPYEAIREIQAIQRAIKGADLTRDQRSALRSAVQHWWDEATQRIDERREVARQKHEDWRGRMEEKVERLESLVEKNENVMSQLQDQIDDLEEKIANAWNPEWADRAREWVQEKYDKISDIRDTNEELEERIRDIRSRLEES